MVARGTFDDIIKQESAGFRSSRNQDSGENARDRAARRLNVKSGKNPNPRTSTAYKPDTGKSARSGKSAGGKDGGRKGTPAKRSPSRAPMQGPPISARTGPQQGPPISARSVDTGDPSALLIPLLLASVLRRGGGADGGAGGGPDGGGGGGGGGRMPPQPPFLPPGSAEAPPQEVPLSRVPNDPMSSNLLRPPMVGEGGAAGMDVQSALPMAQPQQLTYDPAALNDSNVTRFFNEGELGGMRERMAGIETPRITNAPGVEVPVKPRVRVKATVRAR